MPARIKLRRRRRTKIIATLGPASSTAEVLARLFQGGADVFRLNFSHGTHEDHAMRVRLIRELEEKFDRPIGILADVQGPKLRVGTFGGGRVHLQTGASFRLDLNATPGDSDARQPAPSGDHRGRGHRHHAAAGRRQAAPARRAQARRRAGDAGGGRRPAVGPQGRQRAGHGAADPRADRQGPRGPRLRAGARHQLYRPVLRAAAGGRGGGEGHHRRARLDHDQDGKAAGAGQSGCHPGAVGRGDGGARRSRRGTAARGSAAGAEAHRARLRASSAARWWWRRRCWKA